MGIHHKGASALGIGFLILLIMPTAIPLARCVSTEWSYAINNGTYHYKAEESELYTWHGDQLYDYGMLGGTNVPGGDNALYLHNTPSDFDLFAGERLDISWIIEGDLAATVANNCDIHLVFLPLRMDGSAFFELLFSEQVTLETLSHSQFINSTIEPGKATATLKFNDTLDVVYEWDTSTGLLSKKVVTAPSGKQLVVVPGQGTGFFAPDPTPAIIASAVAVVMFFSCFGLAAWQLAKREMT